MQVLTSDPTLAPLLGKRVYDGYAPQLDPVMGYPYLEYRVMHREYIKTLAGNSGTYNAVYDLCIYSLRSADVRAISKRLFQMTGQRSESGGDTTLLWMWAEDEWNEAEPTTEQDDNAVREAHVTITLWYNG